MARMFPRGEQRGGESRYMTTDRLSDIRDITDGQGGILSRYSYDPWGRRNLDVGDDVTSTGYTGHQWQQRGELWLTLYRAYDPDLGRWISNDPIGTAGGINLYGYVFNNPIDNIDPYGLKIGCRSTIERRDVTRPLSNCGAGHIGGCTTPNVSAFTEGSCRRRCPDGPFGFNGFVELSLLVEFNVPRTTNSKNTPGSSIDQHENMHVNDMRGWCSSLNSTIQSEGFKTFGECEAARKEFVRNVNSSRDDARRRSGRTRDK
jgi:RHS repeat-associated protein